MKSRSKGIALLCAIVMVLQLFVVPAGAAKAEDGTVSYQLASTVEAGKQYVIVSNGYALTNKTANVSTASGGTSLASTAVTVADGKITSEVTGDMVWDFAEGTSSKAGPYTTGYFITNGNSKYLSRGSSSGTGVAPLYTDKYDASNVASKPHYCYWAFQTMDQASSSMSMFLFSSDPSDYVFFARGAAAGFDAPGTAQSNMDSGLSSYQVKLYQKVVETVEPDPTEPSTEPQPTQPQTPIYQDTSYSFAERAADLVARMSVAQKGSQLVNDAPAIAAEDLGGGALNVPATQDISHYYWWSEALHGFLRDSESPQSDGSKDNVSYVQSLTTGSTWNPELYYEAATQIADEIRERAVKNELGNCINLNFYSPTVNMQRDPRWGRNEESYSEDPLLVATMGTQFVLGMEGKDQDGNMLDPNGYYKTLTTIKHYTANNSENNRLNGGADTDLRALREYYTAPYRDVIQAADVASVMTAYSTLNGEPCSYSSYLMDTLLRQTFGFSGYITSDCDSTSTIANHKYVNPHTGEVLTTIEQMSGALAHGEDLECNSGHSANVGDYKSLARAMVSAHAENDTGYFTENNLDVAAHRLMTARFSTGEFDTDLAYTNAANARIAQQQAAGGNNYTPERLAIVDRQTEEGVVLLKNDGILPLNIPSTGAYKVAIVGDWQTNMYLGLYSSEQRFEKDDIHRINIQKGITNAIQAVNPDVTLTYITNNNLTDANIADIQAADTVIVVTGTPQNYSRENGDRASIALPSGQAELISQVGKLNPNTVAIMETCGPMQVTKFENDVKAILWSSYGGIRKGVGFGKILTGAVNPSGKLTATWHQNVSNTGVSDIPSIYNYNLYNTNGDSGRTYMYYNGETPVSYPFGYGLSYTTFEYSNLKIDKTSYDANDTVKVTFDVTNTGKVAGKEVTQLYIAQPEAPAELNRPIRRLEGFEKIELQPGETKTVSMEVSIPDLAFYNEASKCYQVDTGAYQVQVGKDSASANLTANFSVSGKMDVYPQVLTVKANQAGDTEAGIEQRLIYDKGQTINPQLTVAMNDESLYGYIIANQISTIDSLHSTPLPEGMTFTYESNRPEVVSVDNGVIKAVGAGVATITITGELNGHVVTTDFVAYVEASSAIDGITVDGKPLDGFDREELNYSLKVDGDKVPVIGYTASNSELEVTVEQPAALPGVAVITSRNTTSNATTVYRVGMGGAPVTTDFTQGWAAAQAKGWTVENGTENASFGENGLTIVTEEGALGTATPAKNLYTMPAFGDWVAQTDLTLDSGLTEDGPQIGMVVYDNAKDYISFVFERVSTTGWRPRTNYYLTAYSVAGGDRSQVARVSLSADVTSLGLRVIKEGSNYAFAYRRGDGDWVDMNGSTKNTMAFPKVGAYAVGKTAATAKTVTYDGFNVVSMADAYPRLAGLTVDGNPMPGFSATRYSYGFSVADGETKVPVLGATAADPTHKVEIEQLTGPTGTATVTVTSPAASTTYVVNYGFGPADDYFADGTISDRWEILREDDTAYDVIQGVGLQMPTQQGDVYSTGGAWKNCFVMSAQGNWEVVAKVFYPQVPTGDYQQAMLLAWQDEDNYIRLNCQQSSLRVEPGREIGGSFGSGDFKQANLQPSPDNTVTMYFKITKVNNDYTLAISQDGLNFTALGTAKDVAYTSPKIGLFISQNSSAKPVDLVFEYVAVTSKDGVEQKNYVEMLTWACQNVADYVAAALPATTTENIALANVPHGYTVELVSSDPAVIAADGTVTPGAASKNVSVSVKVSDGARTVSSKTATIAVPGTQTSELAIVSQPTSYVGALNSTATFTVEASGEGLTYQWYYSKNGGKSFVKSTLPGADTATVAAVLKQVRDGQMYKCVVTDINGNTVESNIVTLSVTVPAVKLAITSNPENFTGAVGQTATFAIEATGEGLTYQWYYSNNGGLSFVKSTMPGATTNTLTVAYKAFRAGQQYKCVVTDVSGNTVESAVATLGTK